MPASDHVAAFALASLVLIVIPGPSVLFVIGRSLVHGRVGGLLSVLGNELGAVVLVAAVAFGVGAVITASEIAFTAIKIVGAAYLVYLGVQAIRHRRDPVDARAGGGSALAPARLLLQGFLVGITNPKTIVFFVAVLPQFVVTARGSVPLQMLVFGLVFTVVALVCDGLWALLAGTARGWFAGSPKRLERMRAGGGGMMIALGGVLLVSGERR